MHFRLELTPRRGPDDGRAQATLAACRSLGLTDLPPVVVSDLYFLDADLSLPEVEALAAAALLDPVAAELHCEHISASPATRHPPPATIEITFLPGVTDSVADNLLVVARSLGFGDVRAAASGLSYRFLGKIAPTDLDHIARDLLANGTVQRYVINRRSRRRL